MLGTPPDSDSRDRRAKIFGFVPAIVTNNKDPDGWYRVRVRFPWLPNGGESGGEESTWARIATFGAGEDRGGYFLPEVGDEVLVAFEHGDIRRPFVIGSMWNSDATATYDNKNGENNIRAFKSRSGHLYEIDDKKDSTKITIKSNAGSTILIDDKDEKVEIHDDGSDHVFLLDLKNKKITMESKTADILIKAKEKLTLDCENLETKAGDGHKMSCKKFDVTASSNFKMTGGKGHVEASSELTLKGSLVDINPPGGQAGGSAGGGSGADSQGGGGSDGGEAAAAGAAGTGTVTTSGAAAASGGSSSSQNEEEQQQNEPEEEHQIEVQLVNALGEAQANVKYELTLPDGTKKTGTSGADGWIRISGLTQSGDAQLVLPDIDQSEEDK